MEEKENWNKKKFLYLDKFTTYQIEDKKWKESTHSIINQLERTVFWLKVGLISVIMIFIITLFI